MDNFPNYKQCQKFDWNLILLPESVPAVMEAAIGGKLFINPSMFDAWNPKDEELAFFLCHGIASSICRHKAEQSTQRYLLLIAIFSALLAAPRVAGSAALTTAPMPTWSHLQKRR